MGRLSNFYRLLALSVFANGFLSSLSLAQQHGACSTELKMLNGACEASGIAQPDPHAEADKAFGALTNRCPYNLMARMWRDATTTSSSWNIPHPNLFHNVRIPDFVVKNYAKATLAKFKDFKAKNPAPAEKDVEAFMKTVDMYKRPAIKEKMQAMLEGAEVSEADMVESYFAAISADQGALKHLEKMAKQDPSWQKSPGRDVSRENFMFATNLEGLLRADSFKTPIFQQCQKLIDQKLNDPVKLEEFLSKHQATAIPGVDRANHVNRCIDECLASPDPMAKCGLPKVAMSEQQRKALYMGIVGRVYHTEARARDTWRTSYQKVKDTNYYLGHKADQGIPVAGHKQNKKEVDECNGDPKGTMEMAKQTIARLSHKEELAEIMDQRKVSEAEAKAIVLESVPYKKDKDVYAALKRVLMEGNHVSAETEKQLTQSLQKAITAEYKPASEKLEKAQHILDCIAKNDPECMSPSWSMIPKDRKHSVQEELNEMQPFDMNSLLNDQKLWQAKPSDKEFHVGVVKQMIMSGCLQDLGPLLDQDINAKTDAAVMLGTGVVSVGLGAAMSGIKAGPVMARLMAAAGMAKAGQTAAWLLPKLPAAYRTGAFAANFMTDVVWGSVGMKMTLDACSPILERAAKEIEYRKKQLVGCKTDPIVEGLAIGEFGTCLVTGIMTIWPLHAQFNGAKTIKMDNGGVVKVKNNQWRKAKLIYGPSVRKGAQEVKEKVIQKSGQVIQKVKEALPQK